MRIGELSSKVGCPVETIRYYEREGLLPRAPRTAGNYRQYGPVHVERLALIRHCRALDMSLDEVRELLECRDHPELSCREVGALFEKHLAHVTTRIAELRALERDLISLRARCQGDRDRRHCGILKELARPVSGRSSIKRRQCPYD